MRISLESNAAKLAVMVVVGGLLVPYSIFAVTRYRAARVAERNDKASLLRAVAIEPGDAAYRERLGHYALYIDQDASTALQHYSVATALNSYSARNWLGVAHSQLILGDDRAALAAIDQALMVDPRTPSVAWEAGNLLVATGKTDQALEQFRLVLANDPTMLLQGLELIHRLEPSAARAAQTALPSDPAIYFAYINLLTQDGDMEGAKQVWPALMNLHRSFDIQQSFFFLSHLMQSDAPSAMKFWKELGSIEPEIARIQEPGNLVENAGFENAFLNGGFDWSYSPSSEVDIKSETSDSREGRHSLLVTFLGRRTSDVGIHQFVVLEPNTRYHFRGYMKSGLQTANGVRFMLIDVKSQKHLFDTDASSSDREWKEYTADFTTPADTNLAVLMIGRGETTLIQGNLLVDDLHLEKVGQ